MDDIIHFRISQSQCICGDICIGITVTKDVNKVTCKYCLAALAVTTLIDPKATSEPQQESTGGN